jgi:hypothetical protein
MVPQYEFQRPDEISHKIAERNLKAEERLITQPIDGQQYHFGEPKSGSCRSPGKLGLRGKCFGWCSATETTNTSSMCT